tara:strand:- start:1194 stop:2435 length:1242 start_codon:yes stop_codon:yes gene_type:complete
MSENMNDEMMNEIKKAAEILGMTEEAALARFDDICSQNNVDAKEEPLLARGLWRQFFVNNRSMQSRATTQDATDDDSPFGKKAFGFFAGLEPARDVMEIQRDRVVGEYSRDATTTYNLGKVAIFKESGDSYEGRLVLDGEEMVKTFKILPKNNVQVDAGEYLVPLDTNNQEWNKSNYGKPLPVSEWRRNGIFIGEINGRMGKYFFGFKGEDCRDFNPDPFTFVHFTCMLNTNDASKIHGTRNSTLPSLEYDSQLEDSDDRKRNMSVSDMQDALMEFSKDNYSPLVNLEAYHNMLDAKDNWNDRFVFTDGTVNSINMTVTPNGNRVIVIDDLTAGFDYESENFSGTTCWVPETIPINFGIGSNVVIVGRTSQGTDEEGNVRPVSINTVGLLVTSVRGSSPDDTLTDSDEDEWIF